MKNLSIKLSKSNHLNTKLKYYIYFDSDNRVFFTNRRKGEDYIRMFNTSVRDSLKALFNLQSKLVSLYYDYFFELSPILCHKLRNLFTSFSEKASLVFVTQNAEYCSVIINSIKFLFELFEKSILILKEFSQINKKYNLTNQLFGILKIYDLLEKSFFNDMKNLNISKSYKTKKLKLVYKNQAIKRTV